MPKHIIALTGMPGARKSLVAEIMSAQLQTRHLCLSDFISGEDRSAPSLHVAAAKIRAKQGVDALARKCWQSVKGLHSEVIVVDGIRSMEELAYFRRQSSATVTLVAVQADAESRFHRYLRNHRNDPNPEATFKLIDAQNLALGLGEVIGQADFVLISDPSSGPSLHKQVDSLLAQVGERNATCIHSTEHSA